LTRYCPAITKAYDWEDEQWKAWTLHGIVVGLFGLLNVMNIYWCYLILKFAAKAASGTVPKDERESADEDEVVKKKNN
jgi:hypothetical protein